jgi:methylated-DNA-[protein]-cysteine S-methyltransferase
MKAQEWYETFDTPIGPLLVTCNEAGITGCHMGETRPGSRPHPLLDRAGEQLSEYFSGKRRSFDLPLAADGTAFQQSVWRALTAIPYGVTRSYREIAEAVGSPKAFRAVGAANGRNPIGVIVPCHRVIGADGSLTGFGGGLDRKRWLLEHEQAAISARERSVSGV